MKKQPVILFLLGWAVSACSNPAKDDPKMTTTDTVPSTSAQLIKSGKQDNHEKSLEGWQAFQDSLRNIILSGKENEVLKNSILQEAYIKNVVRVKSDTLFFSIPFDLHGFDCGAPDCYYTDLNFNFKFKDSLIFPNRLPFKIHEHGCVKKEINSSSVFQLIESDKNLVTYHSVSNKSTLIILKTDERKEFIYYFVGVGPKTIKGNLMQKIFDDYNEEDPKSIVPYRSTIMSRSEYEFFLEKKDFK